MRPDQPTREQLQEAMIASRIRAVTLDEAMQTPCLAIALTNTARAIAKARLKTANRKRFDLKKIAAGDDE